MNIIVYLLTENMERKKFRILSIDGGGIRGIFPAYIIEKISSEIDPNFLDKIDIITGTSTGSIIAAGLVSGKKPEEITSLYKNEGVNIFKKNPFCPKVCKFLFQSIYKSKNLKEILVEQFGDIKLKDIDKPLLIPSTDVGNGCVHVFKSSYNKNFKRDEKVLLRDAVLASCSAPLYFNPHKVDDYLLSDGGLWANNPSLAGVIEAMHYFKVNLKDIQLLSLGTIHTIKQFGVDSNKKWGFLSGWKHVEFIGFILSLQSQAVHNYIQLILNKDQILRIDMDVTQSLSLDDTSIIDELITKAAHKFTHSLNAIREFFT